MPPASASALRAPLAAPLAFRLISLGREAADPPSLCAPLCSGWWCLLLTVVHGVPLLSFSADLFAQSQLRPIEQLVVCYGFLVLDVTGQGHPRRRHSWLFLQPLPSIRRYSKRSRACYRCRPEAMLVAVVVVTAAEAMVAPIAAALSFLQLPCCRRHSHCRHHCHPHPSPPIPKKSSTDDADIALCVELGSCGSTTGCEDDPKDWGNRHGAFLPSDERTSG